MDPYSTHNPTHNNHNLTRPNYNKSRPFINLCRNHIEHITRIKADQTVISRQSKASKNLIQLPRVSIVLLKQHN